MLTQCIVKKILCASICITLPLYAVKSDESTKLSKAPLLSSSAMNEHAAYGRLLDELLTICKRKSNPRHIIENTEKLLHRAQELTLLQDTLAFIDEYGNTLLHYALTNELYDICKLLIKNMSKDALHIRNSEGKIALHLAAEKHTLEIIKMILSHAKESLYVKDNAGKIPLHYAVEKSHEQVALPNSTALQCIETIVKKAPTTADIQDHKGNTPGHLAIKQKGNTLTANHHALTILQKYGANFTIKNNKRKTIQELILQLTEQQFAELNITKEQLQAEAEAPPSHCTIL